MPDDVMHEWELFRMVLPTMFTVPFAETGSVEGLILRLAVPVDRHQPPAAVLVEKLHRVHAARERLPARLVRSTAARRSATFGVTAQGAGVDRMSLSDPKPPFVRPMAPSCSS